ncbi:MAG: metallophosphoesterase [Actinomycetota bacterium]|nr:metallophosphoesterase [Actinomycetota bacterium]
MKLRVPRAAVWMALLGALVSCAGIKHRAPVAQSSTPSPVEAPRSSPAVSPDPDSEAVRVAVIGDWGAGSEAQALVAKRMCEKRRATPFDEVITTGDNFYQPDGVATLEHFDKPEACLLSAGVRFRAAWGNHDVAGTSTASRLGSVSHHFTWTQGKTTFIVLDSNRADDVLQTRWLESTLKASAGHAKIVVFHHPAFTAGPHRNDRRVLANWVGLFEKFNVTLVLSGHNHDYEHSNVNGIDYVVTGGGGQTVYPCVRNESYLIRCLSVHHFLVIESSQRHVDVMAIDAEGQQIDHFRINLKA